MAWQDALKTLAPTVATALGGPLAGAAITAIGSIFGMSAPTADTIGKMWSTCGRGHHCYRLNLRHVGPHGGHDR